MKCKEAQRLLSEVENSINTILGFVSASDMEKAYLAKFLVVYVCGIFEEAIECIINERIAKLGSSEISKFLQKQIHDTFKNPDTGTVAGLLGVFNENWKKEINELPNVTKQSFDNIPTNKNYLAHGRPCNITLDEVITYYNNSKPMIEKIDQIVQF